MMTLITQSRRREPLSMFHVYLDLVLINIFLEQQFFRLCHPILWSLINVLNNSYGYYNLKQFKYCIFHSVNFRLIYFQSHKINGFIHKTLERLKTPSI